VSSTGENIAERARKEHLQIRYEAESKKWVFGDQVPTWPDIARTTHPFPGYPEILMGQDVVAHFGNNVRWLVNFPPHWQQGVLRDTRFKIILIGQITSATVLCFLFAFWQLRPLKHLKAGAMEISKGNLKHIVKVTQRSELGDLAEIFNSMTSQINSLLTYKEDLLASISHELRSPISRIKLAIAVEGDRALPRILKNLNQMEGLITELLDASRLNSLHSRLTIKPIHFPEFFKDLVDAYRGADLNIEVDTHSMPLSFEGDLKWIKRLFANLLENAIKYSSKSGLPIQVGWQALDGWVQISIRDHGPGVPTESLDQLFEPFYRVHSSEEQAFPGFGLGLSICKKIVLAHRGQIQASNLLGGGLCITVRLPLLTHASKAA
jgi:two-component system, OmpR family, sensor histidine kinase CpxA